MTELTRNRENSKTKDSFYQWHNSEYEDVRKSKGKI